MLCSKCHAINRFEALVCFKCGAQLHTEKQKKTRTLPITPYVGTHPSPITIPPWILEQHGELLGQLTPAEFVSNSFPTFIKRIAASFLDHIIVTLAFLTMLLAAWLTLGDIPNPISFLEHWELLPVFLLVHYLYTAIFQYVTSATPGYWAAGIALASPTVYEPGLPLQKITLRWIIMVPTSFLLGLTLWWGLFDREHRFLHDRLTGIVAVPIETYNYLLDANMKE